MTKSRAHRVKLQEWERERKREMLRKRKTKHTKNVKKGTESIPLLLVLVAEVEEA